MELEKEQRRHRLQPRIRQHFLLGKTWEAPSLKFQTDTAQWSTC